MTAQTRNRRGFWQSFFRRDGSKTPSPEAPAVTEPSVQLEAPELEIAPNDPILTYLANASGVVELEKLDLDSPALRTMKAAKVKLVVPLVSQGELIGLLNLGPRLSQQEYSADDRKLLSDLSIQTAPAVRVARLVHQQQEAETRYRTLVEQIPAITYVQEPLESSNPKAVTYVSPQYETILGYPPESQMINEEHWLRTIHPEDRERVLAEEARTDKTGEPFKVEYRVVARDGRVVWVRDEATLVRDEKGQPLYWLGVQYDITEQKRAEEALRQVREAERRRLARDLHDGVLQDLSYSVAAMGLIMLEAEGTGLEEELQRAIDNVRRAAEGLRDAVNDLRLEEERNRPLPELVESLVQRNRGMARGQAISLEVGEGFPTTSLEDTGTEVLRVLQEALTNARRHSRARNVWVSLRVEGDELVAEVSDDGQGFGAGTTPGGVGLKSMRERASAIGGRLEIKSEVGQGTRVRLRLPAP
jgi:PAS domain S-box-containing protein